MGSIASLSRTLILIATAVAALAVFAGTYGAATIEALREDKIGATAATQRMIDLAARTERALGHNGFLRHYQGFWTLGDIGAIAAMSDTAKRAQAQMSLLIPAARETGQGEGAAEFAAIAIRIIAAAETAGTAQQAMAGQPIETIRASLPAPSDLNALYTALKTEGAHLRLAAEAMRGQAANDMVTLAQGLILASLVLVVFLLVAAAFAIRAQAGTPLTQLAHALKSNADGATQKPLPYLDRTDALGQIARTADSLRAQLAEAPSLKTLEGTRALKITLEGPASFLLERVTGEVKLASDALKMACEEIARSGGEGRQQLGTAAQKLNQITAELSSLSQLARGDVQAAVADLMDSARSSAGFAERTASDLDRVAARLSADSELVSREAATLSERAMIALGELADAAQGLKLLAKEARAQQLTHADATSEAKAQLALLTDAASLVARLEVAIAEFSRGPQPLGIVDPARLSIADLSVSEEPSDVSLSRKFPGSRRNAGGLPIEAGDMLKRLGSIAAEVHAAAQRELPVEALRATLNLVARDLSLIAGANAGDGAIAPALSALATHATALDQHLVDGGPALSSIQASVAALAGSLRAFGAAAASAPLSPLAAEAQAVRAHAEILGQETAAIFRRLESISVVSSSLDAEPIIDDAEPETPTLETATRDIERMARLVADLEIRIEAMAAASALSIGGEGLDSGAPHERMGRPLASGPAADADAQTDAAIQTLFEAIERLNNIASALARAGDAARERRYGD